MRGEPLAPGSIRPSEHSLDVLEEAVDLLGVESGRPPMSELDGSIDQGGRGPPVPCPGRAPTFAHGDDVDVALAANLAASATEPTTYVPTRSSVRIERSPLLPPGRTDPVRPAPHAPIVGHDRLSCAITWLPCSLSPRRVLHVPWVSVPQGDGIS